MKFKVIKGFVGTYDDNGTTRRIHTRKNQVIDLPPDGEGHDFERAGLVERFKKPKKT